MFLRRILCIWITISFVATLIIPPRAYAQGVLNLPEPGTMVSLSSAYTPVLIKGLKINPNNPLNLDFIVATGNSQLTAQDPQLKIESEKLIKYFFAALTLPEKDVWVNLSPYEKDRIIPKATGETEMGRDMLAQDYILKQITASMIYPEKGLGKEFWNKVYAEASERFGTTQIPVNTFNKVWIVADKASVYEAKDTVFVVDSHLKVMLEEDYLATQKHSTQNTVIPRNTVILSEAKDLKTSLDSSATPQNDMHKIGSQIVREIVLPALEKEVNEGKNFANLRQIFHSLILAKWYKETLKTALLNQVYSNRNKVVGVDVADKTINEQIYQQYLKAYKKGVFNYIKEDKRPYSFDSNPGDQQPIVRKYFSGGVSAAMIVSKATFDQAQQALGQEKSYVDFAVTAQTTDAAMTTKINEEKLRLAINDFEKQAGGQLRNREELIRFMIDKFDPQVALKSGSIFVPRAVKQNEARMGLTPTGIRLLKALGIPNTIYVEEGLGVNRWTNPEEVYYSDDDYRKAGAVVLPWKELVAKAQEEETRVVVSTKEPQKSEYPLLKNATLFTYLHLAADKELTKDLLRTVKAGIALETVGIGRKTFILQPASHAAGWLSALRFAIARKFGYLSSDQKDKLFRKFSENYPNSIPQELQESLRGQIATVLGGGEAGWPAAITMVELGAKKVYITEISQERIDELNAIIDSKGLQDKVKVLKRKGKEPFDYINDDKNKEIISALKESNGIIGAILVEGGKAPKEISREFYRGLVKNGNFKFYADIAIDQGGNFEVSEPRLYENGWTAGTDPDGIENFTVTNMPSMVPKQVSLGLERAKLADLVALLMGPEIASEAFGGEIGRGFNILQGQITHDKVAYSTRNPYVPLERALDVAQNIEKDSRKVYDTLVAFYGDKPSRSFDWRTVDAFIEAPGNKPPPETFVDKKIQRAKDVMAFLVKQGKVVKVDKDKWRLTKFNPAMKSKPTEKINLNSGAITIDRFETRVIPTGKRSTSGAAKKELKLLLDHPSQWRALYAQASYQDFVAHLRLMETVLDRFLQENPESEYFSKINGLLQGSRKDDISILQAMVDYLVLKPEDIIEPLLNGENDLNGFVRSQWISYLQEVAKLLIVDHAMGAQTISRTVRYLYDKLRITKKEGNVLLFERVSDMDKDVNTSELYILVYGVIGSVYPGVKVEEVKRPGGNWIGLNIANVKIADIKANGKLSELFRSAIKQQYPDIDKPSAAMTAIDPITDNSVLRDMDTMMKGQDPQKEEYPEPVRKLVLKGLQYPESQRDILRSIVIVTHGHISLTAAQWLFHSVYLTAVAGLGPDNFKRLRDGIYKIPLDLAERQILYKTDMPHTSGDLYWVATNLWKHLEETTDKGELNKRRLTIVGKKSSEVHMNEEDAMVPEMPNWNSNYTEVTVPLIKNENKERSLFARFVNGIAQVELRGDNVEIPKGEVQRALFVEGLAHNNMILVLSELGVNFDYAMNGGIDLNVSKIHMQKTGSGIEIKFDPAMIERFKMGNFDGIVPVITGITPIADIRLLLTA